MKRLRIIVTGYMAPTSGQVSVAGFDVFEDPIEVKRRIGYLPENCPLYSEMRVTEYLRLNDHTYTAQGLGASLNLATEKGDMGLLTASVLVMVAIVVGTNRFVWHRLYDYANRHL